MNSKSIIWMGMFMGSLVGGFIPSLWGAGIFSVSSVLFSTVGALLGIWAGFKISH